MEKTCEWPERWGAVALELQRGDFLAEQLKNVLRACSSAREGAASECPTALSRAIRALPAGWETRPEKKMKQVEPAVLSEDLKALIQELKNVKESLENVSPGVREGSPDRDKFQSDLEELSNQFAEVQTELEGNLARISQLQAQQATVATGVTSLHAIIDDSFKKLDQTVSALNRTVATGRGEVAQLTQAVQSAQGAHRSVLAAVDTRLKELSEAAQRNAKEWSTSQQARAAEWAELSRSLQELHTKQDSLTNEIKQMRATLVKDMRIQLDESQRKIDKAISDAISDLYGFISTKLTSAVKATSAAAKQQKATSPAAARDLSDFEGALSEMVRATVRQAITDVAKDLQLAK